MLHVLVAVIALLLSPHSIIVSCPAMQQSGPNGRSRGCGIIEYATSSEAAAAIKELHDTSMSFCLLLLILPTHFFWCVCSVRWSTDICS
jgi:hypothetical protein